MIGILIEAKTIGTIPVLVQVIQILSTPALLPHQKLLILGKRIQKAKSTKGTERRSQKRREVEAQAVTENQERMGREMTVVDQGAVLEVNQVVQNAGLPVGIDVNEIMIEKMAVKDDTKVDLTERGIETEIETGTGSGSGSGRGSGRGIETGTVKGIGTEIGTVEEIGIGTGGEGIEVDLVVTQDRTAEREVPPTPDQCPSRRIDTGPDHGHAPDQDHDPGPIPPLDTQSNARNIGTGPPRPRVPIGLLVRSHPGTHTHQAARTELGSLHKDEVE